MIWQREIVYSARLQARAFVASWSCRPAAPLEARQSHLCSSVGVCILRYPNNAIQRETRRVAWRSPILCLRQLTGGGTARTQEAYPRY